MKDCFRLFLIITCLFFLLLNNETIARQSVRLTIDSLQTALRKAAPDTNRVIILNKLGEQFVQLSIPDSANLYLTEALTLAKKTQYIEGEADACRLLGDLNYSLTKYSNSKLYYNSAIELFKKTNNKVKVISCTIALLWAQYYEGKYDYDKVLNTSLEQLKAARDIPDYYLIAKSYHLIANLHFSHGDYEEALDNEFQAIHYLRKSGDTTLLGNYFNGIAAIYHAMGNYSQAIDYYFKALRLAKANKKDFSNILYNIASLNINLNNNTEAIKYFNEALREAEKTNTKPIVAFCLLGLGDVNVRLGNYTDAMNYFVEALKLSESINSNSLIANANNSIGDLYFVQGNYQNALENYDVALKTAEIMGHRAEKAAYSNNIAKTYLKMNKTSEAKTWFLRALELSKQLDFKEGMKESYTGLAETDSLSGNFKSAFENYKMAVAYKDSLYNEENTKKMTMASMQFEFDNKQFADSLKNIQEKKLALEQLDKQKLLRNGFIAGFAIMMTFSVIFLLQRNKTQKARKRAEQSEKIKQQFLANMSHEIRTPMNAIIGLTNLAIETNNKPQQIKYLAGVQKASDSLLTLINEILDHAKIEAGKIELEAIHFSIRDLVDTLVEILNPKVDEKGIQLMAKVDPAVPLVLIGDPGRLSQVLINLTGNAIKFTEKGSVSLEVSLTSSSSIRFEVIDTGIGIPDDKLSSIFESFSQANISDTRKYGGTGLGLAISKQLVELMGGVLTVSSSLGFGSTFSFELRLPAGSADKIEEQNQLKVFDESVLNGLSILLADDNEANRIVCSDTLKSKTNITITEATNGKEVIEWLKKKDFDLILMDVQMPEMDGLQATRIIRNELPEPKNKIPVIALTASVIRSDLDKCREAGMNDYIPKPFKVVQLLTSIAKAAGREIKFKAAESIKINPNPDPLETELQVTHLKYLSSFCNGDKTKMLKYIQLYLDSIPEFSSSIENALSDKNFVVISNLVHSFKIRLQMMGLKSANQVAAQLEETCRNEIPDELLISNLCTELLTLIKKSVSELTKFKHPGSSD